MMGSTQVHLLWAALLFSIVPESIAELSCYREFQYECSPPGFACDVYMGIVSEIPRTLVTCPPVNNTACFTFTFFLEENGLHVNGLESNCIIDQSSLSDGCYGRSGFEAIDPVSFAQIEAVEQSQGITYQDIEICKCEGDFCNNGTIVDRTGSDPAPGDGEEDKPGEGQEVLRCYRELKYECTPPGLLCDIYMSEVSERPRTLVTCPATHTVCGTLTFFLEQSGIHVNALVADCSVDQSGFPDGCYGRTGFAMIDPQGEEEIAEVERSNGIAYQDIEVCKCQTDYCNTGSFIDRGDTGSASYASSEANAVEPLRCYREIQYECTPPGISCDLYMRRLQKKPRTIGTCPAGYVCATLTFYLEANGINVNALVADCNVDESDLPDGCYGESGLAEIDPLGADSLQMAGVPLRDPEICKCESDFCNRGYIKNRDNDGEDNKHGMNGSSASSVMKLQMVVAAIAFVIFTVNVN